MGNVARRALFFLALVALVGALMASPAWAAAPVAAYALDAGTGTTAVDASGNGNTGTLSGGAGFTGTGQYGGAVSFNGTSAKVTVANSSSLDRSTRLTVEAWVRPVSPAASDRDLVVKTGNSSGRGFQYGLELRNGQPAFYDSHGADTIIAPSALALDAWSFVAATYDGTTMKLYVDGKVVAVKTVAGALRSTDGALQLGGDAAYSEFLAGQLDNVRVYSSALDARQVSGDMQTPVGRGWTVQATPPPPDSSGSELQGVSCILANACTAVGKYGNARTGEQMTLAERWDGRSWTFQSTPTPSGRAADLNQVSCADAGACTAVGGYENSAGIPVTLAERWNGTSWAIQTTPNPSGSVASGLSGVSCASASACTAVGLYVDPGFSGATHLLAERWNGTSWAIQPIPIPTGVTYAILSGVSCTSADACTAVGQYAADGSHEVTLAERWNGRSWKIQPTPNPTGVGINSSGLYGVSCSTATACTAVGKYYNNTQDTSTLAERWNGTSWKIQPTPNPTGGTGPQATGAVLDGVSCATASTCTGVGSYAGPNNELTLAEAWNGSRWTIQPTPNPDPAGLTFGLESVSCAAASACTAVGLEHGLMLVERYTAP